MQSPLSALQRPAYTGPNRCWPCTVANLALLAVLSVLVAVALPVVGPVAAAVVAAAGLAGIWLRGYLVPYTPRIAPRLVARLPGGVHAGQRDAPDDGRPTDTGGTSIADVSREEPDGSGGSNGSPDEERPDDATTGEAVLANLVDAGVVEATEDDVALDAEFEVRWQAEMATLRDATTEELAAVTGDVSPTAQEADVVTVRGTTYVVLSDGTGDVAGESWLRRPTAIAETGAARALADTGVPAEQRPAAADALCLFLESCPVCDEDLAERRAGGCCGPPKRGPDGELLMALVCESCATQFATFE